MSLAKKTFLGTISKVLALIWDAAKMKAMMNQQTNVEIKLWCHLVLLKIQTIRLVSLGGTMKIQRKMGLILKIGYQEQPQFVLQRLLSGTKFQNHVQHAHKNLHPLTNRISNARAALKVQPLIHKRVHVHQTNDFEFKLYINNDIKNFTFLEEDENGLSPQKSIISVLLFTK